MATSVFLWILAPILGLVGRFAPRSVKSDGGADALVYICGLLSVVCALGGFLALFSTQEHSTVGSYGGGQETGVLWRFGVGIVVLAFIANWGANRLFNRGRGKQDGRTLKTSTFTVALDAEGHAVTITTPDAVKVEAALAGRLLLSLAPAGDRVRVKLVEVVLPHYLHEKWAGFEPSKGAMRTVLDTTATPWDARALDRWYTRHEKVLAPDKARARAEWEADCAALLRACRDQHTGQSMPALEAWTFWSGPAIRYLAIEPDGRLFSATGDVPDLAQVHGRVQAFGDRIQLVTDAGPVMQFKLDRDQVAALQRLQAAGRLTVEQAPAPIAA